MDCQQRTYYLYILECVNGSFYTGMTTDVERRYQEHVQGSLKCKYTRAFPPTSLLASWQFECTRADILRIEAAVKSLTKLEKQQLIENPNILKRTVRCHFMNTQNTTPSDSPT